MRLSALAIPLAVTVAAALPGRVPLDTQRPFDLIGSDEHPGLLFPDPPAFPPPSGHETIYETLSRNSRFSRVVKAIDHIEEVAELLNDSSAGITFFAPDDKALRRPKEQCCTSEVLFNSTVTPAYVLGDVLSWLEELDQSSSTSLEGGEDDDDNDEKERKRRFLKMLLRATLKYHILPRRLDVVSLGDRTTHPTHLIIDEALGGNAQRVRTHRKILPPTLVVNLYSHVVKSDIKASNGLIHVVDHPLFPPASTFQELFMASSHFSIFTSAVQRTGLTDSMDFRFVNDNGEGELRAEGSPAVTVFAPTNKAFEALPSDLRLYLFSPFGKRALKKVLEYHIVPEFILHSDYTFNRSEESSDMQPFPGVGIFDLDSELDRLDELLPMYNAHNQDGSTPCQAYGDSYFENLSDDETINKKHKHKKPKHPKKPKKPKFPCPEPISLVDLTLPSLYQDHPLHVHIGKFKLTLPIPGHDHPYRIITKFTVEGHEIHVPDLVAMNGAVHVIDKLLDPRGPRHYSGPGQISESAYSQEEMVIWRRWKEWLYQWAEAGDVETGSILS